MKRLLAIVGVLLLLLIGAAAFVARNGDGATAPAPDVVPPRQATGAPHRETTAPRRPRRPAEGAPATEEAPRRGEPEAAEAAGNARAGQSGTGALGHVVVTVTHEDGSPVRGATVAVFGTWGRMRFPPGPGETDVDGRTRLGVASRVTFRLRATKGRDAALGPRISVAAGATLEQVLVVTPARTVRGRVVDARTQAPVAGAHVAAKLPTDDPFGLEVNATTEPDGSFALPAVPATYFEEPVTLTVTTDGYMEYGTNLLPGDRDDPLLVELDRGLVIRGRCVRVGNVPVPLVGVSTHGPGPAAYGKTGEDGRFELRGVPANLEEVVFQAEDLALRRIAGLPAAPGEIDLGDVLLDPGRPVRGIVVDGAGKPVAGASVRLRYEPLDLEVRHGSTAEDGSFRLDAVGEGPHTLVVTEPTVGENWSRLVTVVVPGVATGGGELRVVLTGKLSLVVVFLLESDRSPISVAEVKVEARHRDSDEQAFGMAWAGGDLKSVRAQFAEPGLYDVTITLPGYVPATLDAVEIFPDREARIDALVRKAP